MECEEIRTMLASIPPPADLAIPVPPNMRAIPTAAVVEAGGEAALVENWARAVKG